MLMCIMMDNESNLEGVCSVNTNNYLGGRMVAEHLVAGGHLKYWLHARAVGTL